MLIRNYICDNDYCAKEFKFPIMRLVLRQKVTCPHCEQEYFPYTEGNTLNTFPSLLAALLAIFITFPMPLSLIKLLLLILYIFLGNILITYLFYELNIFKVKLTKKQY